MDDEYLDAFIRETEESITQLNNALLDLEDDPDDEEAMEQIFRTAHTLKGNFGAMGYDDASDLAHAVEDLLDEFRDGGMEPTPELMDLIFDGVDRIERFVAGIEGGGDADVDTEETERAIREAIEAGGADGDGADGDGAPAGDGAVGDEADGDATDGDGADGPDPDSFGGALEGADVEGPLVGVRVDMSGSEMQSIDGTFLLEEAVEEYDLVGTDPDPEAIEDGEFGEAFRLVVRGEDPDAVAGTFADHSKSSGATATALDAGERSGDGDSGEGSADGSGAGDDAEVPGDADAGDAPDAGGDGGADGAGAGGTDTGEIKSVRIDVEQLDELHSQVEQLVTSRIKLRQSVEGGDLPAAEENLDELDKITSNLQNTVMDMRLIPVKKAVNKFPRLVRDLAREQGKEIDFAMEGTDVELDRTILDEISDPLMHVLRNAVDHGVEPPEERERKGKPREGKIRLRARRERDHVTIEVEDDGGGLDVDRIRREAIEEGIHTEEELERMDDSEIYDLVYHPGFSTSDEVTDVSGRGVGMDVVHKTVTRLDGSVSVDSEPDEGTTVTLRLPVSVAIVKVLFVEVDGDEYGIPIKNIDEISRDHDVETINGEEAISHDGDVYPVIHLADALNADGARANGDGMFVRVRESVRQVVLHCDAVDAQKEVVIKPFQGQLSGVDGLSGTAVVGDGKVIPILDVASL